MEGRLRRGRDKRERTLREIFSKEGDGGGLGVRRREKIVVG